MSVSCLQTDARYDDDSNFPDQRNLRHMQKITIYTTMLCPYCRSARRLFKSKGLAFDEIDVGGSTQKRAEMVQKSGGRRSVPQIWIGDVHVGGCDDLFALEDNGKLDALLTCEDAAS